jgi:hypothetical protein
MMTAAHDVLVAAGTAAGDVWEVDGDPRILLHGQPGQPSCCATNPRYPHVFASVASGGKVAVWNAATHMVSANLSACMAIVCKAARCVQRTRLPYSCCSRQGSRQGIIMVAPKYAMTGMHVQCCWCVTGSQHIAADLDAAPTTMHSCSNCCTYADALAKALNMCCCRCCTAAPAAAAACWLQPLRIFPVGQGMSPLAAAFSPDGQQLAVGMDNGGLKGFEFHPDMRQVKLLISLCMLLMPVRLGGGVGLFSTWHCEVEQRSAPWIQGQVPPRHRIGSS